jgi:hypothetical protein
MDLEEAGELWAKLDAAEAAMRRVRDRGLSEAVKALGMAAGILHATLARATETGCDARAASAAELRGAVGEIVWWAAHLAGTLRAATGVGEDLIERIGTLLQSGATAGEAAGLPPQDVGTGPAWGDHGPSGTRRRRVRAPGRRPQGPRHGQRVQVAVEGAAAHGDKLDRRPASAGLADGLQAVLLRPEQVAQDQVGRPAFVAAQALVAVRCLGDVVAGPPQDGAPVEAHHGVVVDDQEGSPAGPLRGGAPGR